jgi:hypothetical protein
MVRVRDCAGTYEMGVIPRVDYDQSCDGRLLCMQLTPMQVASRMQNVLMELWKGYGSRIVVRGGGSWNGRPVVYGTPEEA